MNFTIFELRLIYHIWRIQNLRNLTNAQIIRKRLLRFYLTFYCCMFASLFFVMKFYFVKKYIFLAVGLTWIPQIIYNTIYKNNVSLPIISILMISLNRIFLPVSLYLYNIFMFFDLNCSDFIEIIIYKT